VFLIPLRDESKSYAVPFVVLMIIAANVFVFFKQLTFPGGMDLSILSWGAVPHEILTGRDIPPLINLPVQFTLFSSMFMHGGLMHLVSNMWFLWLFGDNCEWAMGRGKFLLFYIICGLAAAVCQLLVAPMSQIPMVGASGAIAGVMAGYLTLYPQNKIASFFWFIIFFRIIQVPAWLYIGMWIVFQIMYGLGSFGGASGGGVAYFAHIGGFFMGLFLVRKFAVKKYGVRKNNRHYDIDMWN
jgi:membrane associated rhomboid family serine protease